MTTILSTIIGSQAHGLATAESDTDVREVFVQPTEELFRVDSPAEKAHSKGEDVTYEVAHFLKLATRCNPTILEIAAAPPHHATEEGERLRALFPAFLSKKMVYAAFTGYASSQRHTVDAASVTMTNGAVTDEKRRCKALAARLRILYGGWELLERGTLTVRIADVPWIGEIVRKAKFGELTNEAGADIAHELYSRIDKAVERSVLPDRPDIEKVNAFLVSVRRAHLTPAYRLTPLPLSIEAT